MHRATIVKNKDMHVHLCVMTEQRLAIGAPLEKITWNSMKSQVHTTGNCECMISAEHLQLMVFGGISGKKHSFQAHLVPSETLVGWLRIIRPNGPVGFFKGFHWQTTFHLLQSLLFIWLQKYYRPTPEISSEELDTQGNILYPTLASEPYKCN